MREHDACNPGLEIACAAPAGAPPIAWEAIAYRGVVAIDSHCRGYDVSRRFLEFCSIVIREQRPGQPPFYKARRDEEESAGLADQD